MINEGQDTSANKTHLFNWLYDMTVQMAQSVGVCVLNVCATSTSALCPFVHVCVSVCEWDGCIGCVCVCMCGRLAHACACD